MPLTARAALCALALVCGPLSASADSFGIYSRPDAHAPISVMGDHLHKRGEWMLSYRAMWMDMDGNRDGTRRLSDEAVLFPVGGDTFPVTPTKMDMEMHMVGVMYGLSDAVTLTAMLPFARLAMDHRTRRGTRFRTRSTGLGDLQLGGLIRLFQSESESENATYGVHLNAGLSVPTGNFHNRDDTPLGRVRLPYPMQIGSGTVDLLPGVTALAQWGSWSGGAQATGIIRLGRNKREYRRGHGLKLQAWGARELNRWVSASLRAAFVRHGNYRGDDDQLDPAIVPTADPSRRGFRRIDLGIGLNFVVPAGPLVGNRFAVEWVRPVWQRVQGPQLETDWKITAGWQLAFGGD